ncbi:hypothetical protein AKJ16_DCAP01763 [Drosera capensis]
MFITFLPNLLPLSSSTSITGAFAPSSSPPPLPNSSSPSQISSIPEKELSDIAVIGFNISCSSTVDDIQGLFEKFRYAVDVEARDWLGDDDHLGLVSVVGSDGVKTAAKVESERGKEERTKMTVPETLHRRRRTCRSPQLAAVGNHQRFFASPATSTHSDSSIVVTPQEI